MLTERVIAKPKELLEIMPEKFYFDTLRPCMIGIMKDVKFDLILLDTIEKTINEADGRAANKNYVDLAESFDVLTGVLLSPKSTYERSDSFIRATDKEKQSVRTLGKYIQDILTIIKFSKNSKVANEETKKPRERLGYNSKLKENELPIEVKKEEDHKERIPD